MAAWRVKCANTKIKINDWDHLPPHCHANVKGRNLEISIETFEVLNPAGYPLPPSLRQCLKKHQAAMLKAWESVHIISVSHEEDEDDS